MLNRIVFMGTLGREPDLRKTPSGVSVLTVDLACQRDNKDKDGEKPVDWITAVMWRNTADYFAKYAHKGCKAIVEGKLQSRKWTDKSGNNRVAWEVQADNVYIIGNKSDNAVVQKAEPKQTDFEEIEDEGELPF